MMVSKHWFLTMGCSTHPVRYEVEVHGVVTGMHYVRRAPTDAAQCKILSTRFKSRPPRLPAGAAFRSLPAPAGSGNFIPAEFFASAVPPRA